MRRRVRHREAVPGVARVTIQLNQSRNASRVDAVNLSQIERDALPLHDRSHPLHQRAILASDQFGQLAVRHYHCSIQLGHLRIHKALRWETPSRLKKVLTSV